MKTFGEIGVVNASGALVAQVNRMLSLWRALLWSSVLLVPFIKAAPFVAIAGATVIIYALLAFVRRILSVVDARQRLLAGAGVLSISASCEPETRPAWSNGLQGGIGRTALGSA